ncbi:YopJ family acetyltransferase [Ideonella sp. YS5]|uniref:YopJ family acetyltransferase n=1 Tax=Ideonella sp. YS5 TaxID=3453714 RepID=UPI003EEC057D
MPNHVSPSHAHPGARVRGAEDHPQAPAAQRRRTGGEATPASGPLDGLAARQPGPTLPVTRARAELNQWVRQPGLLIDNPTALEMAGVERLPTDPSAAARAPSTAAVSDLHLPASLPIPEAPRVQLPAGESAEVSAARRQVVDWLGELRQLSAEVHAEGVSPDDEADAFSKLDVLAMPAIVAALNAEKPGLNLVYAHCIAEGDTRAGSREGFGSVDWASLMQDMRPGRWRVLMDNTAHGMALDVAVVNVPGRPRPHASVLVLNAMQSPEMIRAGVVAEIADQLKLPPDWPLLVAEVPAQKDLRSCRIFALSMALKCGGGTFDGLHLARLRGEQVPLALRDIDAALARPDEIDSTDDSYSTGHSDPGSDSDSDAESVRGRGRERQPPTQAGPSGPIILGQELLHPAQIIGPQFMKHAQSRGDVQSYIRARGPQAQQAVNKQPQTLLERHEAHRVARWPAPAPGARAAASDRMPRISSASIELKRISFLDKAIRHAATCDPAQVMAMAGAMRTVDANWRDRYA